MGTLRKSYAKPKRGGERSAMNICKCYFLNDSTKKGGTFPQDSNIFIKARNIWTPKMQTGSQEKHWEAKTGQTNPKSKVHITRSKLQGQQEETAGRMTRQSGVEGRGSTASQQDPGGTDYKAGRLNTKHSSQ